MDRYEPGKRESERGSVYKHGNEIGGVAGEETSHLYNEKEIT